MPHDIIDNLEVKLSDVLKQKLTIAKKAQIAVGFLFLNGFKEIRDEIDKLEKLEILAGSRTNRKTAEAIMLSEKWIKASQAVLEQHKYLNEEQKERLLQEEQKELLRAD